MTISNFISGEKFTLKMVFMFCMIIFYVDSHAQPEKPPRPITVTTYQHMEFGSIIQGNSGGTVIIYPNGTRSKTGDLILPPTGSQGKQAIFNIKAPPGTLITILLGNTSLTNGGYSMTLVPGPTDPVSPSITTPSQGTNTSVNLGGTLTVGNALQNPAGNYSGLITVTFIQQ